MYLSMQEHKYVNKFDKPWYIFTETLQRLMQSMGTPIQTI